MKISITSKEKCSLGLIQAEQTEITNPCPNLGATSPRQVCVIVKLTTRVKIIPDCVIIIK